MQTRIGSEHSLLLAPGPIANRGFLGSSLTDLISNAFGGPRSSIAKYSSKHQSKAGAKQHWRALGESHWDAFGDRIFPSHPRLLHHRGLERAGVKISNSLAELDKPAQGRRARRLSGEGEMHLSNLAKNLLFGERLLREHKKSNKSHLARKLEKHAFDNQKLVGQTSSFFSDRQTASHNRNHRAGVLQSEPRQYAEQVQDSGTNSKKCAVVLDVRTRSEWEEGHISCAHRLEVQRAPAGWEKSVLRWAGGVRTTPIVVYCRSGVRAARAVEMLQAAGFSNAANGGGFVVPGSMHAAGDSDENALEDMCETCRKQHRNSIGLAKVPDTENRAEAHNKVTTGLKGALVLDSRYCHGYPGVLGHSGVIFCSTHGAVCPGSHGEA